MNASDGSGGNIVRLKNGDYTTWKVILKAVRSTAFKITFFLLWHEEMGVSTPEGGANLPSRGD